MAGTIATKSFADRIVAFFGGWAFRHMELKDGAFANSLFVEFEV